MIVLGVQFTRNTSINNWYNSGSIDRELALYLELLEGDKIKRVILFSFGTTNQEVRDYVLAKSDKISIVSLNNRISYFPVIAWVYARSFYQGVDVLLSNQLDGAFILLLNKFFCKSKVIYRSGYSLPRFLRKDRKYLKYIYYSVYEYLLAIFCDSIILTSHEHKRSLKRYGIRTNLIYNYIDDSKFFYGTEARDVDICWVGRYVEQKNVLELSKALLVLEENNIVLVGNVGSLKDKVAERLKLCPRITFIESLTSSELSSLFRRTKVFVLPSLYEGNPKLLLEAMACGCLVVTTKVEGIELLVSDKQVIYSKGFEHNFLYEALSTTMKNYSENFSKVENALDWVDSNVSLRIVSKKYLDIITG